MIHCATPQGELVFNCFTQRYSLRLTLAPVKTKKREDNKNNQGIVWACKNKKTLWKQTAMLAMLATFRWQRNLRSETEFPVDSTSSSSWWFPRCHVKASVLEITIEARGRSCGDLTPPGTFQGWREEWIQLNFINVWKQIKQKVTLREKIKSLHRVDRC